MAEKKTWADFTNKELYVMLSRTFNWSLAKKIYKVFDRRGITLKDLYYRTYDPDAKE